MAELYNGPVYKTTCPRCHTAFLAAVNREPTEVELCVHCLRAELEQAKARCGELADVVQRAMRWMKWNVDYGHMVDWFHRGKRALANPDTKKALALQQAQDDLVDYVRSIAHTDKGLTKLIAALDALREAEEG